MGENCLQTVPHIAYADPPSSSFNSESDTESDDDSVHTLNIRLPPYTAPEKKKK